MPVIRPSRGPGPKPAPMYMLVAIAFITMPDTRKAIRTGNESSSGISAMLASAARPIQITLLIVPRPGIWRSGRGSMR